MADLDKDGTNQSPLAGGSAGSVSAMAGKATDTVKESGARIAGEARQYAGDMANLAKEKSRTMFQQQKETAVGQVDSVAHAIRSTAEQLQGQGQDQVGRYIGMVADQLESFGGRLREKDLDTLISDTQNLARRAPGAFFVGTVVTGFLLSRFLKSSSQRGIESTAMSREEWSTPSATDTDTFAAAPVRSGSGGTDIAAASGAAGTGGTLGTALGTTGTGTLPSSLSGSGAGGNTYDDR